MEVFNISYITKVICYYLYSLFLCFAMVVWIKRTSLSLKSQSINVLSKKSGLSLSFKSATHQIRIVHPANFSLNLIEKNIFCITLDYLSSTNSPKSLKYNCYWTSIVANIILFSKIFLQAFFHSISTCCYSYFTIAW